MAAANSSAKTPLLATTGLEDSAHAGDLEQATLPPLAPRSSQTNDASGSQIQLPCKNSLWAGSSLVAAAVVLCILVAVVPSSEDGISGSVLGDNPLFGASPPVAPADDTTFHCLSDIDLSGATKMEDKGIVIDDTSFVHCPDQLLSVWPNTQQKVKLIRTNAAWRSIWPDDERMRLRALANLVNFVKSNNAKVLIGQDATCNKTSDDLEWQRNLELMKLLGPQHILGVAIGNEMDILYTKVDWWQRDFPDCMHDLWDRSGYWNTFESRVAEMDVTLGSSDVLVTSVWTVGFAHTNTGLNPPFVEYPGRARVRSFVQNAYAAYGKRWVWTMNPYPIWSSPYMTDPGNPQQCNDAIELAKGPLTADMVAFIRKAVTWLTKRPDDLIWAGEYGWSSPASQAMNYGIFAQCHNFTSLQTFTGYYHHFLKWDLSLSEAQDPEDRKLVGLDKAFFFAMRDSSNGANNPEYFGLVKACGDTGCKIT